MAKPLLDDGLWQIIEPLLPPAKSRRHRHPGRKPLSDRQTLTGILFVLKTGVAWEDLPQKMGCGSGMTCWRRLAAWHGAGVWTRLHAVLLARLQTTPQDLYEAARIDGANAWQRFRDITFPWLRPVLLIALLLRTIWTVNDFDIIYLLAFGGPLGATTTLPIEIRRLAFGEDDVGLASALAVVLALLIAAASFVFLRLYHRAEARLE